MIVILEGTGMKGGFQILQRHAMNSATPTACEATETILLPLSIYPLLFNVLCDT